MQIPATEGPIWYGSEHTVCPIVRHVAVHRVLRHNTIPEHSFHCFEVAVVDAGEVALISEDMDVRIKGGHLIVIPPGRSFKSGPGPNRGIFWWIGLGITGGKIGRGALADELLGAGERQSFEKLLAERAMQVIPTDKAVMDAIATCFRLIHTKADVIRRCGAALFMAGEIRRVLIEAASMPPSDVTAVAPAMAMIEARLNRPPKLEELAASCGMGRTAFCEAFRRVTGSTPADLLLQRRLERAALLLAEPGASVSRVARDLGFSSPQYFATAFRRVFGRTPGSVPSPNNDV